MSFNDIMNKILPPKRYKEIDYSPHVTGCYGRERTDLV